MINFSQLETAQTLPESVNVDQSMQALDVASVMWVTMAIQAADVSRPLS